MGAVQKPFSTIEQVLSYQARAVEKRFASSGASLGEVIVRRFPSQLVPNKFIREGDGVPFDKACFRLVMSNEREAWRVNIDMIFHTRKRLVADGSMVDEGVQFNVVNEDGRGLLIDYFSLDMDDSLETLSPEEWTEFWFRKLLRSRNFSSVFAHKEFESELED